MDHKPAHTGDTNAQSSKANEEAIEQAKIQAHNANLYRKIARLELEVSFIALNLETKSRDLAEALEEANEKELAQIVRNQADCCADAVHKLTANKPTGPTSPFHHLRRFGQDQANRVPLNLPRY